MLLKNYETINLELAENYGSYECLTKHRKTLSDIVCWETTAQQVVIVHLDYHLGSKLLTNLYRIIAKVKIPSLIIINDNIALSNEIIYHTNSRSIPQLLFRGTRDGFGAKEFHSKCNNQGPTLTIIKSAEHNQIFGGFTTKNWKSPLQGHFIADPSAFIFKIENSNSGDRNSNHLFRKFNVKHYNKEDAIYSSTRYLSVFGGPDIFIGNDCNLRMECSGSDIGHTYELPPNIEVGSELAKRYLAGSYHFKVSEIEVFKIIIQQN